MVTFFYYSFSKLKCCIQNTAASTGPMNLVLDKCSVVLEELRTIQILTETHSEGLSEQLKMTEKNILEMENLFDQIDQLCLFVQKVRFSSCYNNS